MYTQNHHQFNAAVYRTVVGSSFFCLLLPTYRFYTTIGFFLFGFLSSFSFSFKKPFFFFALSCPRADESVVVHSAPRAPPAGPVACGVLNHLNHSNHLNYSNHSNHPHIPSHSRSRSHSRPRRACACAGSLMPASHDGRPVRIGGPVDRTVYSHHHI